VNPPVNFPEFRNALVRRVSSKELLLRWSIRPTDYDLSDIRYEIFRSQGQSGPWDLMATAEEGTYQWTDRDLNAPWTSNIYFYIVRVLSLSGKGYRDHEPIYQSHDPDHIALEMIRKKAVFFRARSGISCAILARKSWGAKCGRCWDPVKKIPTDPDCPDCFGTGYAGGYTNPHLIHGLMSPPREIVINAGAPFNEGTAYAEIGPDPYVNPDDVFVDRVSNIRYRITTVQQAAHRQYTVSQILTLVMMDENDVVYRYPIAETDATRKGESYALTTDRR